MEKRTGDRTNREKDEKWGPWKIIERIIVDRERVREGGTSLLSIPNYGVGSRGVNSRGATRGRKIERRGKKI